MSETELIDLIEDLVYQFAYRYDSPPRLGTGGLSVLEDAFGALGWDDPHPIPESKCDEPDCDKVASCGWPSKNGYRRTCFDHSEFAAKQRAAGN